jgi:hypothetical protein
LKDLGFSRSICQKPGDVAQLGERRPCKAEVVGSIPIVSIFRDFGSFQNFKTISQGFEPTCLTGDNFLLRILRSQVNRWQWFEADPAGFKNCLNQGRVGFSLRLKLASFGMSALFFDNLVVSKVASKTFFLAHSLR